MAVYINIQSMHTSAKAVGRLSFLDHLLKFQGMKLELIFDFFPGNG